jgi:hypothetical protein
MERAVGRTVVLDEAFWERRRIEDSERRLAGWDYFDRLNLPPPPDAGEA